MDKTDFMRDTYSITQLRLFTKKFLEYRLKLTAASTQNIADARSIGYSDRFKIGLQNGGALGIDAPIGEIKKPILYRI